MGLAGVRARVASLGKLVGVAGRGGVLLGGSVRLRSYVTLVGLFHFGIVCGS